MNNVLADLALESEAATVATLRLARAFDSEEPEEAAFRRLALAVMKYWVCKRGAPLAAEALECLGGNGYVEEAPMAQLYSDIQLGTVWEGSGNVIALDVLRALAREPGSAPGVPGRMRARRGRRRALRRAPATLRERLAAVPRTGQGPNGARAGWSRTWPSRCRRASCCATRRPPSPTAFCAGAWHARGLAFGDLPRGVDGAAIVARALEL